MMVSEPPETEYGEWTRGNMGQVGRTVTTWHESTIGGIIADRTGDESQRYMPMVSWEPHPDEEQTA